MKAVCTIVTGFVLTVLLTSCGTLDQKYIPSIRGTVPRGTPVDGLVLNLTPQRDPVTIGDVIWFTVTIKNCGTSAFWIPKTPNIMLLWTYPDGRKDNMLFEPETARYFEKNEVVMLKPGYAYETAMKIKSYYFYRAGITEFQAVMFSPQNTNPSIVPFWSGRAYSNGHGLMVEKPAVRNTSHTVEFSEPLEGQFTLLPAS